MRVLRLLVYEGPEAWVLGTLDLCTVKTRHIISFDKSITSIILGTVPDEIDIMVKEQPVVTEPFDPADVPF